jgi:type II secretory pathway predicted ATPase ExeA
MIGDRASHLGEHHHATPSRSRTTSQCLINLSHAALALDPSRHVVIYLPNPSVGVRGMLHHIVSALGQVPSFYSATLVPQAADALAAEHAERGRSPVVLIDFTDRYYACC